MAPTQTYWLISVPNGDAEPAMVLQDLKSKLAPSSNALAGVSPFQIPELKVGTLDALVVLSEDLNKHDGQFTAIWSKLADTIKSLLGDPSKLIQNLVVDERPLDAYIRTFIWNTAKYRTDKPLRETLDTLTSEATAIESILKTKLQTYNQVKSNLTASQRKQTGNLSVKSLDDVVSKDDFVLESEYLETILVAVPKASQKEWLGKYEKLTSMVVPRSSTKLAEDDDFALYNVTLFKKVSEDYKQKCREAKFTVRDYTYDDNAKSQQQGEREQLKSSERELWTELLRLARTNFGEMYQIYLHLKALQVFVESVLRFGLPPDFMSATIKPSPKADNKIVAIMQSLYGNKEDQKTGLFGRKTKQEDLGEWSNLLDKEEYFPWVQFKIATWQE